MRLLQHDVALEVFLLRLVGELVHAPAEAVQFHSQLHLRRVQGRAVEIGIKAGLRRDLRLVDGPLDAEVTIRKEPGVPRTPGVIRGRCGTVFAAAGSLVRLGVHNFLRGEVAAREDEK